jgi:hypothetical protein
MSMPGRTRAASRIATVTATAMPSSATVAPSLAKPKSTGKEPGSNHVSWARICPLMACGGSSRR